MARRQRALEINLPAECEKAPDENRAEPKFEPARQGVLFRPTRLSPLPANGGEGGARERGTVFVSLRYNLHDVPIRIANQQALPKSQRLVRQGDDGRRDESSCSA